MIMNEDDYDIENDAFFNDEMSEMERKHILARSARNGLDVERDIAKSGPLAMYMAERRRDGLKALAALVSIDPEDAIGIAQTQATVQEYLNVRLWVVATMGAGNEAKEILKDEFNEDKQKDEDYSHG